MKHCKTFDEAEENKLEYTDIHNEYVKIIESTIEKNLLKEYSQEDINKLMEDIKQDYTKYEEVNIEAFDAMIAFTDVLKFKEQILRFKKCLKDVSAEKSEMKGREDKQIIEFDGDDVDIFNSLNGEDTSQGNQHGWKLILNAQDVEDFSMKYFLRPHKNTNLSK
jgi:hypothetical protein